jgi:SAM-dependent methyltransferase
MTLDDVMGKVMQWTTATDALAAVGATIALGQQGKTAPPEVAAALDAVLAAAGLSDLAQVPPPQQAVALGLIRMTLGHAVELLDNPDRAPGWTYTDPAILDGYGRGSAMLPAAMAQAHPDLAHVTSFLDVGTGVGLLACAAANVWPDAKVVGIDPWETSLSKARVNIDAAGLSDRVELRQSTLAELADDAAFDCVWIPSFFLTEDVLVEGLTVALRALKPGGWVVVGTAPRSPDPLGSAVSSLRWIRGGGTLLDPEAGAKLLEQAGYLDAQIASSQIPVDLVIGRKA